MKKLYMKQKVLSLNSKFTVKNEAEEDVYRVEGSFLRIPKKFSITNQQQQEVAAVTKKVFSFLPRFFVEVEGQEVLTIKKEFSFFKAKYSIEGHGIEVNGNWWDMNFEVYQNRTCIGSVRQKWFSWGDSYEIEVLDEAMEIILVAIVVAIDCVKADDRAAAASTSV